jgi:replication factor C large subunit
LCINKKQLDPEAVNVLGYRDREKIIFDSVGDVFKGRNLKIIKDNIQNIDVAPETFLLWLNENLPREYLDTNDMINGFDALSKADLFFGRVFKRQYYGLWSYACDIMSGGVSTAKSHNYGNMRYFSPTWIRIMKDSKSSRITRDSIIRKIGILCHNSEKKSREFLPVFKHLFSNNLRFACKISNKIELTELEIKYLLGEEKFHKMKEIMQCSEISDEKQTEIKVEKKEIKEEKQEKQETKQPSIFDF